MGYSFLTNGNGKNESNTNKIVIDRTLRPLCCHKQTSFSCRYTRVDITCKQHDVINIQHAHCGLVGPDCKEAAPSVRCLQRVFLRAKPKTAYQ